MRIRRVGSAMVVFLFAALFIVSTNAIVRAQTSSQTEDTKEDETNLDTQLYLLVATNQNVADEKLPAALDGVVKQLHATLPYKNYRLAATLLNRVKNLGRLDLNWIGGPIGMNPGTLPGDARTFSQFKVRIVKLAKNAAGESVVQMQGFNFGARIPIQVRQVATNGAPPVIDYEPTGLSTDISIREGEPAVVGTLNVGPSGDAIILVVAAKRTNR
ncbi:MAG TPA: hypothetical protein VI306_08890 [Pyrinomonadaceae bacterium]